MRLVLPLPESVSRREVDDSRTEIVLEGSPERPVATLTVVHPRIIPISLIEWASEITRLALPANAALSTLSARVERNRLGWPTQVVHAVVTRPGATDPLEARLVAMFELNPYRTFPAAVVARVLEPARFDELRPRIQALFDDARPDWTGPDVASLSQLYD